MNLVQLSNGARRLLAQVDDARLRILAHYDSVYDLANAAIAEGAPLSSKIEPTDETLDYDEVWSGGSPYKILPPLDFPGQPWRVLVSGTGLTHLASVQRRDAMHHAAALGNETDSMKMYRWGIEGGKPDAGQVGKPPEWFYKGDGWCLRGHGDPLLAPHFAEDGGEEPEIAGVYIIDGKGTPVRIGFAQGNEFSDHKLERRNYLYLAHSKLRTCALGPELVTGRTFDKTCGRVAVYRGDSELWSSKIRSGEQNMCHSLANIEHHHFKYEQHRRPGDVHIHFFGADAFSFGCGLQLQDGDVMEVAFDGFGKPLRNPLLRVRQYKSLLTVRTLD